MASFAVTVDMHEHMLMLRKEVQESAEALESLRDMIGSGFRQLAKQNSLHQARYPC